MLLTRGGGLGATVSLASGVALVSVGVEAADVSGVAVVSGSSLLKTGRSCSCGSAWRDCSRELPVQLVTRSRPSPDTMRAVRRSAADNRYRVIKIAQLEQLHGFKTG